MTPEQEENRYHKVAQMIADGTVTIEEAEKYCDTKPWEYGKRDEIQGELL